MVPKQRKTYSDFHTKKEPLWLQRHFSCKCYACAFVISFVCWSVDACKKSDNLQSIFSRLRCRGRVCHKQNDIVYVYNEIKLPLL